MSESLIKSEIRKRLSSLGIVIWQQATGHGMTESGSQISFGLCRGSSDLIGIRKSDGKFVAVECKTPSGYRKHCAALERAMAKNESSRILPNRNEHALNTEERRAFEQHTFVALVWLSNGLAGFATSADEAERIVTR
jgi:hypothetical protein